MNTRSLLARLAALSVLALVGCSSPSPAEQGLSRRAVEAEIGRPGVPIYLPAKIPDGYQVLSVGPTSMRGDTVQQTSVLLMPVRREDTPLAEPAVDITVQAPVHADIPGTEPCDVERAVDHFLACVRFLDTGSPQLRDFWQRVEFTTDLDRLSWLR